jgi:Zn finger protein HypA/HybF involved in hydrogenase expression
MKRSRRQSDMSDDKKQEQEEPKERTHERDWGLNFGRDNQRICSVCGATFKPIANLVPPVIQADFVKLTLNGVVKTFTKDEALELLMAQVKADKAEYDALETKMVCIVCESTFVEDEPVDLLDLGVKSDEFVYLCPKCKERIRDYIDEGRGRVEVEKCPTCGDVKDILFVDYKPRGRPVGSKNDPVKKAERLGLRTLESIIEDDAQRVRTERKGAV